MASVVINGETSGSVTLSAPAVAGSVTVTLPAASGTMATTAGLSSYATLATPSFTTTIGVGGATPSASGSGITFPATASSSTDANTLDEYEEGTWTPNLGGNTTYSNQVGTYAKIGRLVFANFSFAVTTLGTGGSISQINGLPFTSGAASQNCANLLFSNTAVATSFGVYYMGNGGVVLNFSYQAGASTGFTNNPNIYQNGTSMSGSIVYYANA